VRLLLIACICIFAVPRYAALAETVVLKDGKKIVGEIVQETTEAVVISKQDGGFVYSIARERISVIRESTPAELKKGRPISAAVDGAEKARLEKIKEYRLEQYEKEVQAAKKARGKVRIKFVDNRFGVVEATINGSVKADLLVDTGATLVVITSDVARELGIDYANIDERIHVILADGSIRSATPVTLSSIKVGPSVIRNVDAAISESPPGGGLDGLLGMSFLSYFHVKLDSSENCLVLEKY
jgi:clan AA aspartic protease (TIGR02281 family)